MCVIMVGCTLCTACTYVVAPAFWLTFDSYAHTLNNILAGLCKCMIILRMLRRIQDAGCGVLCAVTVCTFLQPASCWKYRPPFSRFWFMLANKLGLGLFDFCCVLMIEGGLLVCGISYGYGEIVFHSCVCLQLVCSIVIVYQAWVAFVFGDVGVPRF